MVADRDGGGARYHFDQCRPRIGFVVGHAARTRGGWVDEFIDTEFIDTEFIDTNAIDDTTTTTTTTLGVLFLQRCSRPGKFY